MWKRLRMHRLNLIQSLLITSVLGFLSGNALAINCTNFMPEDKKLIWTNADYAITGDTLVIQNQKVRLIGLDAPQKERKQKFNTPGQPLADESQAFLNKLIANHDLKVGIYYDATQTDKFGRQLAHAFFEDGTNLQQEMLKAGLAIYRPEFDNNQFAQCYIEAENTARQGGYQLWDLLKKNPELHYPLVESSTIYAEDEGYRIVRGEIVKVDKSSGYYILNMDTTGIRIPERAWDKFNFANLRQQIGNTIEVRGQIYHYKGAMFTIIESPFAISSCAQNKLNKMAEADKK